MEIELLVRAVIGDRGHFLIAHTKGASNTYLPGGHLEAGESLKHALARELNEELGITAQIGHYLGAVEHAWQDNSGQNHEISHLFEATSPDLGADQPLESLENHIDFIWLSPDEFDKHNLQPAPLRQLLANLDQESRGMWWASTIESRNR